MFILHIALALAEISDRFIMQTDKHRMNYIPPKQYIILPPILQHVLQSHIINHKTIFVLLHQNYLSSASPLPPSISQETFCIQQENSNLITPYSELLKFR